MFFKRTESVMKKLKIAYVTPRYYPYIGGVEYVVRNLAERLALNGHDVTVIAGEPHVKKAVTEELNNVKVVRVPTYTFRDSYHVPKEKKTMNNLLKESFDVVHVNSVHAVLSLLPLDFKKFYNPDWKLVLSMHHSTEGYGFFRRTIWKLFWKRQISKHLEPVDLVHATSPFESDIVSKHFPNVKGKLITIPLGLEQDVFNYNWTGSKSDYLLYCGRLEKYKGIDLAAQAVSHLAKLGHNIQLQIVGVGSMLNNVKQTCENDECISYSPPKPREEYLQLLSNARGAISLSSAENFNLFLAEAYAMGVPLIATPEAVAFRPELATVTDLTPTGLAECILNQLASNKYSKSFTLKSWNNIVTDFERVYNSLL